MKKKFLPRSSKSREQNSADIAEQISNLDVSWISPIAALAKRESKTISKFLVQILSKLISKPNLISRKLETRWTLTKNLAKILVPQTSNFMDKLEQTIVSAQGALGEISAEILNDPEIQAKVFPAIIETIASTIEKNPRIVFFITNPQLTQSTFGEIGELVSSVSQVIPALSKKVPENISEIREIFFASLYELTEEEREGLSQLCSEALQVSLEHVVFPKLDELFFDDPRSKIIVPILTGAAKAIPPASCLTAAISIACTPNTQLTTARLVAIAIQELGGLYIKVTQVLAELCPPGLAKELRTSQDDAGGLFPSIEKSWHYLLNELRSKELKEWRKFLVLKDMPQKHFASASIGAIYEILTTELGKTETGCSSVLIKIQRPDLKQTLEKQLEHLIRLCDLSAELIEKDETLSIETKQDLLPTTAAIRRSILNYHKQSNTELDFSIEKINADRVSKGIGLSPTLKVPQYFFVSERIAIMDRMPGNKVTRIVQNKYLERKVIADKISFVYLDLLFNKGIIWADPHPGNILYDDKNDVISFIDLNPCYEWDQKMREEFKHLLYRLMLHDAPGLFETLYELVENPDAKLENNIIIEDLEQFLDDTQSANSLTRIFGEFIRTLSENEVDLKIEVQAALRGISQIALTTSSISAQNDFRQHLQAHLGLKEIIKAGWQIGALRTFQVLLSMTFNFLRQKPNEDCGPVVDERDLLKIRNSLRELRSAHVCEVVVERVSPDDYPNLSMTPDGSTLMISSYLQLKIITTRRPATVCYVIQIPSKQWLKERQEFVKLEGLAKNLFLVESLEQLRRYSLDDFWRTAEAWSKGQSVRTLEESRLVASVHSAARRLLITRLSNIWESPKSAVSLSQKYLWKYFLNVQLWKENATQKHIVTAKRKFGNVPLASVTFSTFYRIKMILIEGLLWIIKKQLTSLRFQMHILPLNTKELCEILLFGMRSSSSDSDS